MVSPRPTDGCRSPGFSPWLRRGRWVVICDGSYEPENLRAGGQNEPLCPIVPPAGEGGLRLNPARLLFAMSMNGVRDMRDC